MSQGTIEATVEDGIATITFSHPKSNALPRDLLTELTNTIKKYDQDRNTRVIVLQSPGDKAFCAGAYFSDLLKIDNKEDGKHFFMGFANVINTIRKSSKLILARVQGKTVGGGVGLIAASDYAIGTTSASVRLSELQLGIGPFVVGPAIKRKMGVQGFTRLSLDAASWNSAEWAFQKGLYTELVESMDELDQNIQELARQLADYNPKATKELKRALWDDATDWDTLLEIRADTSGRLLMTDYAQNKLKKLKDS